MNARLVVLMTVAWALPARAQDLRSRVEGAPDGIVRLSYAAKEGVCGNGRNITTHRRGDRDGWESDCDDGPVRVALEVLGGRVRDVRTYVGGRWRNVERRVTDLGSVGARDASAYFLSLAEREGVRGDVVLPAILADSSETWPTLLRIAKNENASRENRKHAVFWLSQEASEAAAEGLTEIAEDDDDDQEVRKQAVFALSQLPRERGVPALIRVAKTNRDPAVRKSAIFWLGQSNDPRAIELFEELLVRR